MVVAPLPRAPIEPASERPQPTETASWLGAGLALGVLNLPKLGTGLTVAGELRAGKFWPIELSAVYWFTNDADLSRDQLDLRANPLIGAPFPSKGSRVSVRAVQASLALCPYEHGLTPGSLLLCAGAQGGVLRAEGSGFKSQSQSARPLFALEAYARWHFQLGEALGVSYSAGIFVPLMRDRFGYTDRFGHYNQQFRQGPAGGRLDLVLTHSF